MRAFRDLSIRYKLTLMLMGVVSIVLLAVSVANVIGEVHTTRATLAAKYTALAKIIAAQSGAALSIADVDASGVQQIMSDLAAEPSIRFAALFNAAGVEVVRYPAGATDQISAERLKTLGALFSPDGHLEVVENISLNGAASIGKLCFRATTEELKIQIRRTIAIAAVVYLIALAFALLLSFVLQRLISAPILQLANLTRRVSVEHNYSLAVENRNHDELGALCDQFNAMLAEIRRRDDELSKSNEELMRSNDELRQFAYVASHDLQEPLRSITGFCNLLKEEYHGRLDEQADTFIERIVNGAKRMKSLVTDLLGYSRVSQDQQRAFDLLDFQKVVDDALANLQGSIQEAGAEVSVGPMPAVLGDRAQLIQLMQNLIGNAIKYRSQRSPQIQISARKDGDAWQFSVTDNGIGIAPEHHQQIFEIFKRLHGRDKYPGTGIGLAVCKKIVQRHLGQFTVDSQVDSGSTFRFTIQAPRENPDHDHQYCLATSV
jgi:signal transduction histidine kinase